MKIGSNFYGSTIKWLYQNPQKITKRRAFVKSMIDDKLNWLLVLISLFLIIGRNTLPARDMILGLLIIIIGIPNLYSNTINLSQENHSVYGYTEDFVFKTNDISNEQKMIPFSDIHEIRSSKTDEGNYNLSFYTIHIGRFTKGLTKAKIIEFKNVQLSLFEVQQLKSKIKIDD